jgi:hypothetical protein
MRPFELHPSATHFTETATGKVRHMCWISPHGEVLLPVALQMDPAKPGRLLQTAHGLPYPRKVGNKHVFKLPGGREVLR